MKHGGEPPRNKHGHWIDLSTGISPVPYPLPDIENATWCELPSNAELKELLRVARLYYKVPDETGIVAGPGTDSIIFRLPQICPQPVSVIGPTYSSHIESHGRAVSHKNADDEWGRGTTVLVNPDNPTGRLLTAEHIRNRVAQLRSDDLLIIDEAFMDPTPEHSIVPHLRPSDPVLVLKSFGKFFGLAGLRLGFVVGPLDLMNQYDALQGNWAVSGPAIQIAQRSFLDKNWQSRHRIYLSRQRQKLSECLKAHKVEIVGQTDLFILASSPTAHHLHEHLANAKIWTRIFDHNPQWIRFGVPGRLDELARIDEALLTIA